jgi:hypothetical protein
VNKHIVYEEIGQTIQGDANSRKKPPIVISRTQNNQPRRGNGKHETEQIVQFEGAFSGFVVTLMPKPHKAMHHVFVGKPSHKFHEKEK